MTLLALGLFSWTAWRESLLEAILSMAVLALYGILYYIFTALAAPRCASATAVNVRAKRIFIHVLATTTFLTEAGIF